MPDKDIDKIPITVEVPKADVWLRADYRDIVHRLGEVHMVRACEHQHDDDFVPMYDSQTIAEYQQKTESLRLELDRAWAEVDRIAKQIGEMTTERLQDQLTHGNIMGRIAVNLFGRQNNVTDEECVAETARLGYGHTALVQRIKKLENDLMEALNALGQIVTMADRAIGCSPSEQDDYLASISDAARNVALR
jgi:Mg2+ and Co2+ transporter CorA